MSDHSKSSSKKLLLLALGALGVVYGDIGTSPLYAIKEIFFGHALPHYTQHDVFGVISLVFWALTLVVAVKYVFFVLRADSDGEGGVFALYSLINQLKNKLYLPIITLLVIAAGLLYGDGIITPAISVLSAVEGLSVVTRSFDPYIIPITLAILTALFVIQIKGTAKVGSLFGPVMLIWFAVIAVVGAKEVALFPGVLAAINPIYAITFLTSHSLMTTLLVLGSVMLVMTGGEAMYADMGHFGKIPIRLGWYAITFPALLLNYFGQGAFLLRGGLVAGESIFFSMVPHLFLIPVVILATAATVIASQALISGAFSLTAQAISLGLFPYLPAKHTHAEHEGQIYIPFVNWALYIGAVTLVIVFRSSTNLAAAYGLAVSGVMFVTTLGMIVIAKDYWKWPKIAVYGVFIPFLCIDTAFLVANSLKFIQGGYIPVYIGLFILVIIRTWEWGRSFVRKIYMNYPVMKVKDLVQMKKDAKVQIPKTIVIMSPKPIKNEDDDIPMLKQLFIERYGLVPYNLIFLHVALEKVPRIRGDRHEIVKLFEHDTHGLVMSVIVHFGFMEDPNVERAVLSLAKHHELPIDEDPKNWCIHVVHERMFPGNFKTLVTRVKYELYMLLHRNTERADHYFGLGRENGLTIEVMPIRVQ
jgi:KUP system potassium uptake protein